MTSEQARTLLMEMQATWPHRALDEAQVAVWCKTLSKVSYEAARIACDDLRETSQWMPSHAEFLFSARRASQHLAMSRRALVEATGEPLPVEEQRRLLAQARRAIKSL